MENIGASEGAPTTSEDVMPSKSRTRKSKATSKLYVPTDDPGAIEIATADERLLTALRCNPGKTTAELAHIAEIGKSTAARYLNTLEKDGKAARTKGIGARAADSWSAAEHAIQVDNNTDDTIPTETKPDESSVSDVPTEPDQLEVTEDANVETLPDSTGTEGAKADEPTESKPQRLKPGGLHGLVEDVLRDKPDKDFSPGQIAKALQRSAGAVANALDRHVTNGLAVQTNEKPKRYRLASSERAEPEVATS
ncbi:winged helix-turn-helix domain-containing protein [Lentzea sp. JNUCC 0626]|uniref:winged helix-turn-helix domain-containing protein n=1 Tax=Lentzea sp. JNUCC 0626 TaxID=3367513 RepID=UPI003747F1E4